MNHSRTQQQTNELCFIHASHLEYVTLHFVLLTRSIRLFRQSSPAQSCNHPMTVCCQFYRLFFFLSNSYKNCSLNGPLKKRTELVGSFFPTAGIMHMKEDGKCHWKHWRCWHAPRLSSRFPGLTYDWIRYSGQIVQGLLALNGTLNTKNKDLTLGECSISSYFFFYVLFLSFIAPVEPHLQALKSHFGTSHCFPLKSKDTNMT